MVLNIRRLNKWFVFLFALLVTVRLHPDSVSETVAVYWADALLIGLGVLWFLIVGCKIGTYALVDWLELAPVFILLGLSIYMSSVVQGHLPYMSMLNLGRFVYYGFALIVFTAILRKINFDHRQLLRFLDWFFIANLIIALTQLLEPPLIRDVVQQLFGTDKLRSLWSGYPRVYGAFHNANWFGVYLVFTGIGWLAYYAIRTMTLRPLIVRSIPLAILLTISGSRTALLGIGIGGLVIMLTGGYRATARLIGSIMIVSLLALVMILALKDFMPLLDGVVDRFTQAITSFVQSGPSAIASLEGRIYTWNEALEAFVQHPLSGYGDSGLNLNLIPHNSYLTLLLDFGLFGTLSIAMWVILQFRYVLSLACRSYTNSALALWFISFSLAFGAMAFLADFFHTTQVMLLWIFLLSLAKTNRSSDWSQA